MNGKIPYQRIIFGLKVKQLRTDLGLSFADLAKTSCISVSYLNEIEKGKKFPKQEKIRALAAALSTTDEELLSTEMGPQLAPVTELLQSNFLNELPLDMFGIELGKVAEFIANAPLRVGAFISTLLELSRSYAVREENFYFAALRAFLELNNNYFEEIETAVARCTEEFKIDSRRPIDSAVLANILRQKYGYQVENDGLDAYPELQGLRSVYLPKHGRLLLNSQLTSIQATFQLGKEIGFQYLELKERSNTSSILRGEVFEEVINHAYATYFSVALNMPLKSFVDDMQRFFAAERWDGEAFLTVMQRYAATPEMYYHRLTNVIPRFFNMPKLFFLRFLHDPEIDHFEIDKELHLSKRHHPHSNGILEHYCRRWVSLSLLDDLNQMQREGKFVNTIVRAQRSHYVGTNDEYLCLTLARPGSSEGALEQGDFSTPNRNVSVTLGLLINDDVRDQIRWLNDPAIQIREVSTTCERCAISNCEERAVPPKIVKKRERLRAIHARIDQLNE
jgi:predicted transcriptional regulator/DNA-binding XRE family transcriptional regulator